MTGEQFASRLTGVLQPLLAALQSLPVKVIQKAAFILLAVWLVIALSQLVWVLIPDESPSNIVPAAVVPVVKSNSSTIDLDGLKALDVFGAAGLVAMSPIDDVPASDDVDLDAKRTRLDISLEGVANSSVPEEAVAIVVYQGKHEQYFLGDKLPVSGRVILAKVLSDHVIIDNNGTYESVWLYEEGKLAISANKPSLKSTAGRSTSKKLTSTAERYRKKLYSNPQSLMNVVRVQAARKNNQMIGYRVRPGTDKELFDSFGFKPNDIVTSVNGIMLNEPSSNLKVYKLMRTAQEATFMIDRNGVSQEIVVSLGDG
ncbi:type II secretion system protein GspC [bacterium]|nr:type II secretion system protein GspC [bacterium]